MCELKGNEGPECLRRRCLRTPKGVSPKRVSLKKVSLKKVSLPESPLAVVQPKQRTPIKKKRRAVNICTTSCCYDVVRRVASEFGLVENPEQWHVYWTDMFISVEKFMGMKYFQRVNHFPGMVEICRKDLLAKKLVSMANRFPSDFNFFPKTWCLPNELIQAVNFSKLYKNKMFIVKPCYGSKGRGIQVISDLKLIKNLDRMICQVYIHKPFLIDGYKLDFRVYALVTSCEPLRLYVYNEGIARFATRKYEEPNESNFSDRFMHLTNYSVNRRNSLFNADGDEGSKRKLSTVNEWMKSHGYDVDHIWASIDDSIIKTILMVVPTLRYCYKVCFPNHEVSQACFELLGFDFILNRRLKPYLLEVNHSPSFYCHTPVDHEVKEPLLRDTFKILDLNKDNARMPEHLKVDDKMLKIYAKKKIQSLERKWEQDVLKAHIDWENSHMGNYRLVYPNKNAEKYKPFLNKKQRIMSRSKYKLLNESVIGSIPTHVRKNPFPFSQDSVSGCADKEESRVMRTLLLQSHYLMNNFYNDLKSADQRRFMDEIQLSRRNEWDAEEKFSKQYAAHREKFTQKVSGALQCISQKSGLKRPEKELLSSLLLNPPVMAKRDQEDRFSHLGPLLKPPDALEGPRKF
uniref:Tubulin polyglutamylase TTLL6 n=1 Tax=Lygus hesperus TaxID=30085 RepID=A0A0A9ZGF3_LYGHE